MNVFSNKGLFTVCIIDIDNEHQNNQSPLRYRHGNCNTQDNWVFFVLFLYKDLIKLLRWIMPLCMSMQSSHTTIMIFLSAKTIVVIKS